jgi:alanine racemase
MKPVLVHAVQQHRRDGAPNRSKSRFDRERLTAERLWTLPVLQENCSLSPAVDRIFRMESYLTAEVSARAVAANMTMIRSRLDAGTRLCVAVKANCYGHGLDLLLPTISRSADWLAVAAPVEAAQARALGYAGPLLVFFTPCACAEKERQDVIEELLRLRATLTVTAAEELEPISRAASRIGSPADVHVKIDSGMGRSGVLAEESPALAQAVRATPGLRLAGLYTHFATADEPDGEPFAAQLRRFLAAVEAIPDRDSLIVHAANSAATIESPASRLDMVRCGLAVYGYQPAGRPRNPLPLRPALRVWGRLLAVKRLPAGAGVGYGLTCTLRRDSVAGLVPIGYGDGYFRSHSNRATMRIRGRDVPVLGRVSMDQTAIDLTDVRGATPGDEVEIISPDPAAPHSVENLARLAGTISYEVTCSLMGRVRRVLT